MANIDKVTLNGTDYKLIDSTVPSWAKTSRKPTYTASEISGLAAVATSGNYNDLSNKPTIPNIGTLNTNNSTAQTASSSESFSGNISLHKISKTGSYNDLLSKPDLLDATYSNGTVYFVNSSTPTSAPSNYYTKSEVDTAVNNRLKYVLLSQSEYDNLATKDSGTLYLIPNVTKYSVSLSVTGTANTQSVTINNVVYQRSEFPIEVNGGDTLSIICSGATDSITITMGGNTVAESYAGDTLTVSNVNDDIVITSYNDAPA